MVRYRMQGIDTTVTASLIEIIREAGKAIMEIYDTDFSVEQKGDKSPLTLADKQSHQILSRFLRDQYAFPVLSEEGRNITYEERRNWGPFWLLDPLDGTKEFIKKNGEFTVNIALIHAGSPVVGVVFVPAKDMLYYAVRDEGAYKIEGGRTTRLPESKKPGPLTIVGSRSHASKEFDEYVEKLKNTYGEVAFLTAGSSLKFCLVAEGLADIYPRLGPTMEWDTAAGQVIVEEAGGIVVEAGNNKPLTYNKENLLNPFFIAFRRRDHE